MPLSNSMLCAIPATFCRAVVMVLQKKEKGINVEDFEFLTHFQELARITKNYKNVEKYRNYFPAIYLIYQNYHKKVEKSKGE